MDACVILRGLQISVDCALRRKATAFVGHGIVRGGNERVNEYANGNRHGKQPEEV